MDAVILRMMPVHEPERLVQFGRDLSYPLFRQFGKELHCFTDMFAQSSFMGRRDVIFNEEPETASTEIVSSNYYSVLGISALCRTHLSISEIDRSPEPLAVISYAFGSAGSLWIRRDWPDLPVERPGVHDRWRHPARFHGVAPGTYPTLRCRFRWLAKSWMVRLGLPAIPATGSR